MALYLEPLNGGRQIVLDKAVVLIGRQSDCDVILDGSRKVSRRHCAIAQVNDRYMVRDLESMNGVTVNGSRVKREAPIQVGDEISFGDVRYVLRDTNALKAAAGSAKPAAASPEVLKLSIPPVLPQKPAPPARPVNISQKFPVPIAEEDVEFAVEPSIQIPQSPILSDPDRLEPIVELEPDDAVSGPESRNVADDEEQLPEVIIIDSGEFDAPGRKRKRPRRR